MEDSKGTNKCKSNKRKNFKIIPPQSSKEMFDQIDKHFAESESAFKKDNPKILEKRYFVEKVDERFKEFEKIITPELNELFRFYPEFIPSGKIEDIDVRVVDDDNNEIFNADIMDIMRSHDPTLHIYNSILYSELDNIGKEKPHHDGVYDIEYLIWFCMKAAFMYLSKLTNTHRRSDKNVGESFYKNGIRDYTYFNYQLQKLLSGFSIDIITEFQQ